MNKFLLAILLLCLTAPVASRAQSGPTRPAAPAADTTKTAGARAPKVSGSALASEPRDTSDHADNRGDEYNQGTYDSDPRYEGGEQGTERDDTENKRESDGQTGQSEEGGSGQE